MPSILHDHQAKYEAELNLIRVGGGKIFVANENDDLEIIPNDDTFELDLSSFRWKKAE